MTNIKGVLTVVTLNETEQEVPCQAIVLIPYGKTIQDYIVIRKFMRDEDLARAVQLFKSGKVIAGEIADCDLYSTQLL